MKTITTFTIILLVIIFMISCGKEETGRTANTTQPPGSFKRPPVANAGADIIVILPTDSAELAGTGIDPDGRIIDYKWEKIFGPVSLSFNNPHAASVKLRNLAEGSYGFEFTVTDNDGLSTKDWLRLLVTAHNTGCVCYPDPCDPYGDPCDPWDY